MCLALPFNYQVIGVEPAETSVISGDNAGKFNNPIPI